VKVSNEKTFESAVRANQTDLASKLNNEFDYIVCGSGSSGSVVAGRLASNPAVRVLLLEAGRDDDPDLVMDPNQWMRIFGTQWIGDSTQIQTHSSMDAPSLTLWARF
jgi:choline dehydrogenase